MPHSKTKSESSPIACVELEHVMSSYATTVGMSAVDVIGPDCHFEPRRLLKVAQSPTCGANLSLRTQLPVPGLGSARQPSTAQIGVRCT